MRKPTIRTETLELLSNFLHLNFGNELRLTDFPCIEFTDTDRYGDSCPTYKCRIVLERLEDLAVSGDVQFFTSWSVATIRYLEDAGYEKIKIVGHTTRKVLFEKHNAKQKFPTGFPEVSRRR